MKMAYDGFITKGILNELNTSIIGGKINKIFQPTKNELLLGIYSQGKNYALLVSVLSSMYRMHLTTYPKPNPSNAFQFCMVLRKHILGYSITNIKNDGLERIITITLEGYNELNDWMEKKLVIELMGKHSNVILLSSNNIIIDSLRHLEKEEHSYRDILPGRKYIEIVSDKVNFTTLKSFKEFQEKLIPAFTNMPLSTALVSTFNGFSKSSISVLLSYLNIEEEDNTVASLQQIYDYLQTSLANVSQMTGNQISSSEYSFTFSKNKENSFSLALNFFLDDFYHNKEESETFISYRNTMLKFILSSLKKLENKIKTINQKLKECENKGIYQLYGELITANLYQISSHPQSSITLSNYYENNKPIVIPLDAAISPAQNAKKYFKKYSKLKNAEEIVITQKQEILTDIDYIESIVYTLENAKTISDIDEIYSEISNNSLFFSKQKREEKINKKNKKKKKVDSSIVSPLSYSIDGYTVLVGKNNKQNDYLTCKLARNNDLWFHTKEIHGSHVILKQEQTEFTEDIIAKCASIAAYYSKAKLSKNIPVDYTLIKYVKKPSGAKPGMVIYTNQKTLYVNPYLSE